MKTNNLRRYFLVTLTSLFTAAILTACGGGGGSSTGSGGSIAGSASVSGNVNSGIALNQSAAPGVRLMDALFELVISEANAAGVSNVTVELLKDGVVISSQITGGNGEFQFTGIEPGNYTIRLTQNGQVIGVSPVIQLDVNTRTKLEIALNGGVMSLEVEAEDGVISGEVEDDISNDDQNSEDDVSNDDQNSEDNKSEDNKSEDDCKPDESNNCDDD